MVKQFSSRFRRVGTIPACTWRTDRRTPHKYRSGKNYFNTINHKYAVHVRWPQQTIDPLALPRGRHGYYRPCHVYIDISRVCWLQTPISGVSMPTRMDSSYSRDHSNRGDSEAVYRCM